ASACNGPAGASERADTKVTSTASFVVAIAWTVSARAVDGASTIGAPKGAPGAADAATSARPFASACVQTTTRWPSVVTTSLGVRAKPRGPDTRVAGPNAVAPGATVAV